MKLFLFIIVISLSTQVFSATSDERKQKIAGFTKECIAETGVAGETVQKAFKGDITDDPKLKAFTLCMTKKAGLQNANGDVQIEELRKQLPSLVDDPEAAIKLVEKCVGKDGSPEDIAFQTFSCFYKKNPIQN